MKPKNMPLFKAGDKVRRRLEGSIYDTIPFEVEGEPKYHTDGWYYSLMGIYNATYAERVLESAEPPVPKYSTGTKVVTGTTHGAIDRYYWDGRTWLYSLAENTLRIFREEDLHLEELSPAEAIQEAYGVTFVWRRDPEIDGDKVSTLTEGEVVTLVKRVRISALEDAIEAVNDTYRHSSIYDRPTAAIDALKEQS